MMVTGKTRKDGRGLGNGRHQEREQLESVPGLSGMVVNASRPQPLQQKRRLAVRALRAASWQDREDRREEACGACQAARAVDAARLRRSFLVVLLPRVALVVQEREKDVEKE